MNTKSLIVAGALSVLLGGTGFAAGPSEKAVPTAKARVSKVAKVADMDRVPLVLIATLPDYPKDLRGEGIQGIVTVEMVIDATGRVVSAELVGQCVPELGRLALVAAKDWTFVPASAQGKPIMTRVRVPIEFVMPELVATSGR